MVLLKKTTDPRPVFLNLFKIHLPINALVSILHRVTGIIMILTLPLLVMGLIGVVSNPGVYRYMSVLPDLIWKIIIAATVSAYMYHLLAGIRHMYHDFSGDHALQVTQISSVTVLALWVTWIGMVGAKLWLF